MCLSPEVDLLSAAVIAGVAVDTLRRNPRSATLPIAAIPAIFAVHQFASALMWWQLRDQVPDCVGVPATQFFVFVGFALWPISVPIAFYAVESTRWRKHALLAVGMFGAVAGLTFFETQLAGNVVAIAQPWYVTFDLGGVPDWYGFGYMTATCLAVLLSSNRYLFKWGLVNAVGLALIALWWQAGLPSIWCFWAALTSFIINGFIRHEADQNPANSLRA